MLLDYTALATLELLEGASAGGGPQGSLLAFLDRTATPMGRRRLRQWIARQVTRGSSLPLGPRCSSSFRTCRTSLQHTCRPKRLPWIATQGVQSVRMVAGTL